MTNISELIAVASSILQFLLKHYRLPITKPGNRIRLGLEANYLAGKPNNMSFITALVICDLLFWSFIAILLFSWRELSRGDKPYH
jgi:hypothetical protein